MGDTAARIVTELREKFHRHDVWVWYDSQETYTGAIDDIRSGLAADDINVAVYEDSFLELKHRVWKEDPDLDEQWLFYVPTSKNDAEWFMDIHSLGKQYRTGADVDSSSPASQYLIEHESAIPDEFSTWGQNEATRRKAFFCVLFGTQEDNPAEWILRYLDDPDAYEETIQEYGQTDDWSALLDERYGISASLDPEDIATEILFGEVAVSSPTSRYDELAADERIESKRLCEYWQQHDPATYVEYARSVAAEYDLKTAVLDSGNVDWHSTAFRGIDEGLVRLCLDRLNDADYVDLPEIAADLHSVVSERRRGFWYEEGYAGYWDVQHRRSALWMGLATHRQPSMSRCSLQANFMTATLLTGGPSTGTTDSTSKQRRKMLRPYLDLVLSRIASLSSIWIFSKQSIAHLRRG
ncbi:hypothetical protein ACFQFH_03250 [Halobaculum halobium]|uniref:hypothetical protein n=1 Tax=Halobaculum halobium TaxID=3032281 RepID=UPI003619A965